MTGHSNASTMRLPTGWSRPFLASMLSLVVGLALGLPSTSRGQTVSSDSQTVRPERVDQVRDRIETIRRFAGPDRTLHVGSSSPVQPRRSTPVDRRPWAERPRFQLDRARLRAVIEDVLAEQTSPQRAGVPLPEAERIRPPQDSASITTDTVRIAPDTVRVAPNTVRMARDSVRLVRDTLQQTRVERIESAFLDEGVFRAFEVNFAFGTATLQPRATRTLDAVGAVLEQYPDVRIEIAGHTDATGPDSLNARLSRARAAAVRTYLSTRYDLRADRLVARGYGEARPIAPNRAPAGRALNRRVAFRVLNPGALSRPRR
jgi:outer membrane protein OmpA-like peptidoglycan-associated protein